MTEQSFRRLAAAAIAFAALLAYANTFANEFVWDDASSILLHDDVQHPSHVLQLFTKDQHAYGRGQGNFYRPFVSLSFMIESWLTRVFAATPAPGQTEADLSPFLFHVGNLFWHALAGIAMFALMSAFGAPRAVRLLAPLLYVVHPLHTEAIAYISGRADPMAGAFVLFGLAAAVALPKHRNAIACGLLFIAALLCKESATILPFVLLLAAVAVRGAPDDETAPRPNLIAPLIVSGALVGVYAALRFSVLQFARPQENAAAPLTQRIAEAGQAFALYLKLIFLPTGLHMERTLDGVPGWAAAAGWLAILGLVAIAIAAFALKRHRIAFALGFFLVTWLPISGIFPLNAPMAEHWMYLPLAGFVWALLEVVWMAVGTTPLRYAAYAACYAAGLALMVTTAQRNTDWRDNESLYAATLAQNPNSIRVTFNLGVTYEDLVGNASGARRQYERVLALYRERKQARGETGQTETFYDDEIEAHLSLGKLYASIDMPTKAASHFETLRRVNLSPANQSIAASAYIEYAKLLAAAGRPADAEKLMEEGASRIPALKQQMEAAQRARQAVSQGATPTAPH